MQQRALPLVRYDMSYQQSVGLCSAMEAREDGRSAANRDPLEHKIWAQADSSGHKNPDSTGCWLRVPRLNRFCTSCQQGVLGDEKHIVVECPALQDSRDRYENLFQAPQGDAMILFMWQDDIMGVARFIGAC